MVSPVWRRVAAAAAAAATLLSSTASAQTWSACNPTVSTCPADTALGMTIDVEFTQGEVNSFVASGGAPTYGPDGATFTVAGPGNAPQLTSVFYIMFGRVEITMKCAPGAGIVSTLVLQSDDLDEIDMEWLGADGNEVQTNYFGKGQTTTYNRGQFNPAPNNQAGFVTYTIDWTADRIIWYVGGTAVRTLLFNDAAGQYPQTPMQVKFGAWSGGDSANAPGTIQWARGPTDYSKGPFSMSVKSVLVSDYSTGKAYTYGDTSGTWQSIRSDGGAINANKGQAGSVTVTASASVATQLSPSIPAGGIAPGMSTQTKSKAPTATSDTTIPDGWTMTPSGKIVPAGSSSTNRPALSSWAVWPSASSPSGPEGLTTVTTYDGRGFPTTLTMATQAKSYDSQGFVVSATRTASSSGQQTGSSSGTDSNKAAPPVNNGATGTTTVPRLAFALMAGGSLLGFCFLLL
ncbi:concanavalin A-like lectin/glucanase domain-containing protein [Podospora appendiculata]|uniref:Crh-like protein n=1 Tax=Podospora appendiculata TaxID=314037 RepID=A0AAE0XKM1_9PEZI|nr:concanavalin A-like lectin/glucanase domain-containing protein [Podospora appendiculata]